jgi:hypothetical protein
VGSVAEDSEAEAEAEAESEVEAEVDKEAVIGVTPIVVKIVMSPADTIR